MNRTSSFQKRRRGLTLLEVMLASTISAMVAGGILSTFYYGTRAQATAADSNQMRSRSASIIATLAQDIRNTSAGGYNNPSWPKLTASPSTAPVVTLSLIDTTTGMRVVWVYTRATGRLTRAEGPLGGALGAAQQYNIRFANFRIEEISRAEWIGDTMALGTPSVTSIRIVARVVPTLSAPGSIWAENDANGDGDTVDDEIAAGLFNGTNAGDHPGWSFIYNTEAAFRNT